jgi:hypothetical protein
MPYKGEGFSVYDLNKDKRFKVSLPLLFFQLVFKIAGTKKLKP